MPVQCKSIYEDTSPDDGMRVLTTNYWPRGISRERAGTYLRILGPTRDLLRGFKDGTIPWDEYEVETACWLQVTNIFARVRTHFV